MKGNEIMKTRNLMAVLVATTLLGTAAWADEMVPTTITTAKGERLVLYRSNEPTIALFTHGQGVYRSNQETTRQLTPVAHTTPKGQDLIKLYRFE